MFFKNKNLPRNYLSNSRLIAFSLVCIFLVFASCSKEEKAGFQNNNEIVMPIKKPIPPKPTLPFHSLKAQSETKSESTSPAQMLTIATQEAQPEKSRGNNKSAIHIPVSDTLNEHNETLKHMPSVKSFYRVQKGDSLAAIAERNDVYENPLKWTSLFRLNLEKFEGMKTTTNFQNQKFSEEFNLKYVTVSEAAENRKRLGHRIYAVSVLSAETSKKITPRAITLIKKGYNAYISTAIIEDKEWMRLRVGFFPNYAEAAAAGEHITTILDINKVWIVKINENEIKDYCGY